MKAVAHIEGRQDSLMAALVRSPKWALSRLLSYWDAQMEDPTMAIVGPHRLVRSSRVQAPRIIRGLWGPMGPIDPERLK